MQRHARALAAFLLPGKLTGSSLDLSRAIGSTVLRQIVSALMQFIALWLITRRLGPAGSGLFAVVMLLPYTLHALLNLGLGTGHTYFVSQGAGQIARLSRMNWLLAAVLWLAATLVLAAMPADTIARFLPHVDKRTALLATVLLPAMLLATWSSALVQGLRQYGIYNKLLLIQPALFCAGVVACDIAGRMNIETLLTAYLVSYVVFWWWNERKLRALAPERVVAPSSAGASLRYGLKAHLSNVVTFLNYRIDLYLVSYLLDAGSTGQYSLAMQLAERLWMISFAASVIVFPEASAHAARPAALRDLTRSIARPVFAITAGGALVAAAIAPFAIPFVFGAEFRDAVLPFVAMLPGIALWSYMRILSNALAGMGRVDLNTWAALVCLAVNVAGNLFAIPRYGALGAALASSVAYAAATCFTGGAYRRLMARTLQHVAPQAPDLAPRREACEDR